MLVSLERLLRWTTGLMAAAALFAIMWLTVVDVVGRKYSITPSELLELKGRAAKLFSAPPGGHPPPEPREESAMKPTFVVNDLEVVRAAAKATGGFLKPLKQAPCLRRFQKK